MRRWLGVSLWAFGRTFRSERVDGVVDGRTNQRKRSRLCIRIVGVFVESMGKRSVVFVVSIQNGASRMYVALVARGAVASVACSMWANDI